MKVEQYTEAKRSQWEDFVNRAKNATFMHTRNFIDYHGSRFEDHSLLVYSDADELMGIMPVNINEQKAYSHQGLTYGGLLILPSLRLDEYVELFKAVLHYSQAQGWKSLVYKTVPAMYYQFPAFEDEHLLFLAGAKKIGQHINPCIQQSPRLPFQERRRRGAKKALKENVQCGPSNDIAAYWKLLTELLAEYQSSPVHSFEEITDLMSRFPNEIFLHAAMQNNEMLAGILCFQWRDVVRFQYIAASHKGKELGAPDALFSYLIDDVFSSMRFIDFGTSTNEAGKSLAMGISQQKEGFGARTSIQPIYEVDLNVVNWDALNHFVS